jgi:hypothetical protein
MLRVRERGDRTLQLADGRTENEKLVVDDLLQGSDD